MLTERDGASPHSVDPTPLEHPDEYELGCSGFICLAVIAAHYQIAADPVGLAREAGVALDNSTLEDVARTAGRLGLKARLLRRQSHTRMLTTPLPAIVSLRSGGFALLTHRSDDGRVRLINPITKAQVIEPAEAAFARCSGDFILITRRLGGAGVAPRSFGFTWFLPSIWRYRRPLAHVLVASILVQIFALVTPLFFQVVIDKVLVHNARSTLIVMVIGLALISIFEVVLQYLRMYVLSHTTSRIDVELGARLFEHMLRLPLSYFETRPAGQTVARMRELETIRSFLTGQGLSSAIDLVFCVVFLSVLFAYSTTLTLIVIASLPIYVCIAAILRPMLKSRIDEKFDRGAISQQFLVETIVGIQTLKAAAVEPAMRRQWEDRLAAYVKTSFKATMLGALGQNAIQYVNKSTTALIIYFGALSVIDGEMSVGALVAFSMIMGHVTAPIVRLSQLWQDFQQVQISVERIGDILNAPAETRIGTYPTFTPIVGDVVFDNVTFRYASDGPEVLSSISLRVPPGQVLGIVGASGSGKSTLTKLLQRLYLPDRGQILIDGIDISQMEPGWLRRQIGVVLQENLLFNRTIHENIALANPGTPRAVVIDAARLAGADEFISKMPRGYDTLIEERGSNLSGGQRQRIAIARALVTQPRILILDEATSALDYESERIVQANMRHICTGRTVVIVAHRLAAVRHCDRIIAIDGGRIVEDGSHDVLLRREGGIYSRLWRLQTA